MELRKIVAVIWRRLWLILFSVALVAGFSYLFSVTSTRIYQASTTIEINYGTDPRSDAYSALVLGQKAAVTYVEHLRSPQLARDVASALGLNMSPGALLSMLTVAQVRDTQFVQITAQSSTPDLARAVPDKMAELFIAQSEAKQDARFQNSLRDLNNQLADLEKLIADTQKSMAGLGDPSDAKNGGMPEFARVERTRLESLLSNYQTRYAILLRSVEDFRLAAARSTDHLSIFKPAETPSSPVRPVTSLNVLLGLMGGLILGISVAFLLDYLDDTAKGPEEITTGLGLTVLGSIIRFASSKSPRDTLVTVHDGKSPTAEAYRVLRTNFQFSGISNPHGTVVVTSAGPREGKTTTLANLGVALAQARKRVILVDADLRRPSLHKLFGVSRESGLTDLMLNHDLSVDQVLLPTEVEGLRLLPSGPIPPNPAEILSSPRMTQIINTLKEDADIVLFDTPPVLSVADATLLAGSTGNVILVVASGETRTGAVAQARDAVARTKTRILGVVLNKLQTGAGRYYHYYHYDYGSTSSNDDEESKLKAAERKRKVQ